MATTNMPELTCRSIDTEGFGSSLTDEWFSHQTCPMDGEQETGALPHQAEALKRYLVGQTAPDAAAASMAKTPEPGHSAESPTDLRDRVLGIVEAALFELPQRHTPQLVLLLKELNALPGQDESGAPLWKGLKTFADSWSDCWKQSHWREALSTRPPHTRIQRRQAHVHRAFVEASCAMATVSADAESGLLPLSWGYECISDALESRQEHVVCDFELPAAAIWIRLAGARMIKGAEKKEKSWALERRGRLWPPGPMSVERWDFWMNRLEEMNDKGQIVCEAATQGLQHGRASSRRDEE